MHQVENVRINYSGFSLLGSKGGVSLSAENLLPLYLQKFPPVDFHYHHTHPFTRKVNFLPLNKVM